MTRAAVLVDLDATSLPTGPLVTWVNNGSVSGDFTAEFDIPQVTTISGIKGVTLDGNNDWYVGPIAPAAVTGNGSRTIYAWVWNLSHNAEETVFSWSRRGGPAGTHTAFNHGYHGTWGAVAHWDAPDIGWNNTQEAGIWTCIAYTYDNATGLVSVYTNGQLANSKTIEPLNVKTGAPFVVGCENSSGGFRDNNQLPGSLTIAKIKVHDTALSAAEIASTYNADATTFGRAQVAIPTVIGSFSATAEGIYRGDSTTLNWSVSGHDTLSISPPVTIAGSSATVSPLETTTYTLTATGSGGTKTATVTIHVDPGLPVAEKQTVAASRNTDKAITLVATDPNPPPGGFTWTIVTPPANGSLGGTAPILTYTPTNGYSGTDEFTFKVNDGHADSNTAKVSITVNPPATAPTGITPSSTIIAPDATGGSFIANLAAIDPNFFETHTYLLVAGTGSTHNNLFSISGHQVVAQAGFVPSPGVTYSIRVQITDSTGRSTARILTFTVGPPAPPVVINEIFYDPPQNARTEFIELHNTSAAPVSIAGWSIASGVDFTFPGGASIPAGGHAVVAMDPAAFLARFGFAAYGPFTGRLSGDGEKIELRDSASSLVDVVDYKASFPWPVSAGSDGASMELINPSLDNDIGGSWRGSRDPSGIPFLNLVPAASSGWIYRSSQTNLPPSNWRTSGYTPDGSWSGGQTPIGFGTVNDLAINTNLGDMRYNYSSVFARKTFTIAPGEVPDNLLLRYTIDDGIIIWINGVEVERRGVSGTDPNPATATTANTFGSEGVWYNLSLANGATLLNEGTNVIAVRCFNYSIDNLDFGFDVELIRPSSESAPLPTPGDVNSTLAANPPPQIRQVAHSPEQPSSGESTVIAAKVTDPQGVGSVQLLYQVVAPGNFIPATFPRSASQILADPDGPRPVNPAFEDPATWTTVTMVDDGSGSDETAADGTFTAVIPAQSHRTLVRYRISASDIPGESIRVPYTDDDSLNFAYFVYDGVPDYIASSSSVHPGGAGKVWPKALLTSLPVYHWLIRSQDMAALQAYNGSQQMPNSGDDTVLAARRTEDWEGAFVYDGVVYDHVRTRLRGGNSRYGDNEGRFTYGKRHYKFQFNDGHHFQARDQQGKKYPNKWSSLAVNKMFGNKGGNGWGMPEEIGARLWATFGVPAANTHWFHFRVIDGAAEAPDQYNGDFWGIQQVIEEYQGTFLDARNIEKGNLYKMSDWIWDAERQRRYQSPDMVRDGSEFNNIRDHLHAGQTDDWLVQHVDYDSWYRYSAVAEAIRHYDVFPYTDDIRHALKNLAWHFSPVGTDPTRGRVTFLPYDWDASFGPNWNNGWDHANNALYNWDPTANEGMQPLDKPLMKVEHRNVLREFSDLIWQPDQIESLMDDRAAVISEYSKADQDRWRNAPQSAGTANDDTLSYKVQDMKNFCFTGWTGATGPTVGAGGRAAYLVSLAAHPDDNNRVPATPVITYTGEAGHPLDGLSFAAGPYAGPGLFDGMAWRIGEIEDPDAPAHDPDKPFILEYDPIWESGELATYQSGVAIPAAALKLGRTYRARVRMKNRYGRWSHWSAPYEFTTAAPTSIDDLQQYLMITEVMYHPAGPALPGGADDDFEYLELQNISEDVTLDLANVRFHKGIDFDFSDGEITLLFPGERVLVVKNRAAFEARYGTGLPVAGEWELGDSLSNGGEQIALAFGADTDIHNFTYGDAFPWPSEADGGGPSMALTDPLSAPDHALAASWSASISPVGSPGLRDGPFAAWLFARGANNPDAEAAPGMSFAMMYALGADFAANPQAAMPTATFTAGNGEDQHLTLSYRRRIGASEVSYTVETAIDLDDWQSGPGMVEQVGFPTSNGDGTETVTVRVIAPVSDDPTRFIRLQIGIAD